MTEITRVPIQPVAKGSLTKLWLGVLLAVLVGAGLAYAAVPKGVSVDTITAGTGPSPTKSDVIFARYVGKLSDGTEFDRSRDMPLPIPGIFPEGSPLPLGRMIPGFAEGAVKMRKGGKYTLFIPAAKGYGAEGQKDPQGVEVIPPNSDLTFEVELVDIMTEAEFQARLQALQQAMQMQQGAGPAGSAPGAGEMPVAPGPQP